MTVVVPSLSYTDAVLTENAFYPLFLTAALAIAHAVRRPVARDPGRRARRGRARWSSRGSRASRCSPPMRAPRSPTASPCGAPSGSRTPAGSCPRRSSRCRWRSPPQSSSVARGEGVFGWLGQRSGTFDEFHLYEVPYWFVFLAVGLVLYVAVAPAVASTIMVVTGLRGRADDGLAALRRRRPPDRRRDAAERRLRQRLVRRGRDREPQRALRVPRRPAALRRPRALDRARAARARGRGRGSSSASPASRPRSSRSSGSTTTPACRRSRSSPGTRSR